MSVNCILTGQNIQDSYYGVCDTAFTTAEKVVTISNFILTEGATVAIKFTAEKPSGSTPIKNDITLNINNTGAKLIYYKKAKLSFTNLDGPVTYIFIYDGTYYQLIGIPTQINIAGNAETANSLHNTREIDGVSFNGTGSITHYGVCSNASIEDGSTIIVSIPNFKLVTGAIAQIKFNNTLYGGNAINFDIMLNINSTGAKNIYKNGTKLTYDNNARTVRANDIITFVYTGSYYEIISGINDLPTGGTTDQVLAKNSDTYYDTKWVTPVGKSLAGQTVYPTIESVTAGEGAEIFNLYKYRIYDFDTINQQGNVASGNYSHAEGYGTTASGSYSHAEGYINTASGFCSHAEGEHHTASGNGSHAEGSSNITSGTCSHAEGNGNTASGFCSHAEGKANNASEDSSHVEGQYNKASANGSHAEGTNTEASGYYSHAGGENTVAEYWTETAIGRYNIKENPNNNTTLKNFFVIGKGDKNTRANAFRVNSTGNVYGTGNFNSSGADYAEYFEWKDKNQSKEDHIGRFVSLDGEKIKLANSEEEFILGITSGNPSIVGDVHDDQWQGMYLYDIYGRPIFEDVEVPDETIEEPDPENPEQTIIRVITPAHTEHRQKLNPGYDNTQPYKPRSERPEWACVGMLGKLVMLDDGTCEVNGYCKPSKNGIATWSYEKTKYRVMSRLDDTHIRVLIL